MSKRPKYMIDGEYAPPTTKLTPKTDPPPSPPEETQTIEQLHEETQKTTVSVSGVKVDSPSVTDQITQIQETQTQTAETLERVRLNAAERTQAAAKRAKDRVKGAETVKHDQTYELPVSLGGKPKEGSIGEALVNFDPVEQVVTHVADVGTQLKDKAAIAKIEGDNLAAGIYASAYMGTNIGIGFVEGFTFFVRPHKMFSAASFAIQGLATVLTSPDPLDVLASGAIATGAVLASNPVAFVGQLTGGVIGGVAFGKTINKLRGPKTVPYKPPTDTDIQDFLVPEDIYPHQVVASIDDMALVPESTVILDDLGGGFLDSHLVPRGKWSSSRITGYRQTGGELIQEFIPEGLGTPTTVYHPLSVPTPTLEHTLGLGLNVGSIVRPRGFGLPIALGTITGVASIEHPTVETPDLAIEQDTQELIDAGLKQEVSITSVTKHKGIQIPKIKPQIIPVIIKKPDVTPYIIPNIIPDVTPVVIPDFGQGKVSDVIPIAISIQVPKSVQKRKIIQETQMRAPVQLSPTFLRPKTRTPVRPSRIRKTRQVKRRRRGVPPLGYETKKYKMAAPKDFTKLKDMKVKRMKKLRLPKL